MVYLDPTSSPPVPSLHTCPHRPLLFFLLTFCNPLDSVLPAGILADAAGLVLCSSHSCCEFNMPQLCRENRLFQHSSHSSALTSVLSSTIASEPCDGGEGPLGLLAQSLTGTWRPMTMPVSPRDLSLSTSPELG